nr:conotoxin precursor Cver01 [Conus judaeus]UMA83927.1 conotoxin precursor Cver01 [Conus judaeus]DAZ86931.1 TPA_inf: conotoxin precursor Cver01 [Conus judaeus]
MNCLQPLLVLLLISTITALYQDDRATPRGDGMSNLLNILKRQCDYGCPTECSGGNSSECCSGITCSWNPTLEKYFCVGCGGGGGE